MGAKTCLLAYSSGNPADILKGNPVLDRAATTELAKKLFPSFKVTEVSDDTFYSTYPSDDEIVAGCFPGLSIVAAQDFGVDYPSRLSPQFLQAAPAKMVFLHAMHSAVDWLAFGIWQDNQLKRSLSLSPDSGVLEDVGGRLPFESPFWNGERPAIDPEDEDEENPYPFPFHPLELGEAAMLEIFGFQNEGEVHPSHVQPGTIALMRFKRKKAWWRRFF